MPLSPFAFNLSQHQGLFQWVSSLHQVGEVLELQLQHQSFQWVFRLDFLKDWLLGSPFSPRDSQESSPAPYFENINSLVLCLLYGPFAGNVQKVSAVTKMNFSEVYLTCPGSVTVIFLLIWSLFGFLCLIQSNIVIWTSSMLILFII